MPLHDACYLSGPDKIFGVTSNNVIRFNASTGVKEAAARVCAPMYGEMRIAGSGSDLFVASINDWTTISPSTPSNKKEIWSVDPTTLAITNPLGLNAKIFAAVGGWPSAVAYIGATYMEVFSGDLWFYYVDQNGNQIARINISNPVDYQFPNPFHSITHSGMNPEQFTIDGVDRMYVCDPQQQEAEKWQLTVPQWFYESFSNDSGISYPIACVYVPSQGKAYGVAGTETLIRFDSFSTHASTSYNLGLIEANVKPMRIRLGTDGKLYIPCQFQDVVIVFDPATETGVSKTGFDSPIDVVFTPSKKFAVQTGLIGLKEIT